MLALSGRTDVPPGVVPAGVTAVIERRLARLPEPTISLLQVAAVIGQDFVAETLAALSDVSADAVSDILSAATNSGVLMLGANDRIVFAHDLIRQVALRSMPPSRAAALHLAAANHHILRLDGDATRHAAIADHLAHAGTEQRNEASQHWVAAAEQALARLAYEEAASCFVRARQLADPDPMQRCRLLLDEGSARIRSGALMEGRACFDSAADLARETGRVDLLAEAALGLGVGESGWAVPRSSRSATLWPLFRRATGVFVRCCSPVCRWPRRPRRRSTRAGFWRRKPLPWPRTRVMHGSLLRRWPRCAMP